MIKRNLHLAGQREAEKDEYLIAHLAVAEGFRRQGVGQALIEKATQGARAMNYSKLVLEVEIENYSAVALYHKAGFETVQTFLYKGKQPASAVPGSIKC
jgi:ribosomal protein S18 acetylase RimI-like enzyme